MVDWSTTTPLDRDKVKVRVSVRAQMSVRVIVGTRVSTQNLTLGMK